MARNRRSSQGLVCRRGPSFNIQDACALSARLKQLSTSVSALGMFLPAWPRPYSVVRRVSRSRMRASVIRTRLLTNLRAPRQPPYCIPFDEPLTARSLQRLAAALPQNALDNSTDSSLAGTPEKTKSAAVLIALCNVDGQPGILLEVRGKLRTHSGEIR